VPYYEYNGHEVAHYEPDDVPASVEAWSPSSYAGRDGLMTQGYVAVDRYCNSAPDTINGSWEVHQTTPAGIRWSYVAPVRTMACPVNGGPMRVVSLPDGGAVADASGSTSAVGLDLTGFNAAGTIVWTKDLRDATADANQGLLALNVSREGEVVAVITGNHPCIDDHQYRCSFVTLHFYSGATGQPTRSAIDWEGTSIDVINGEGGPMRAASPWAKASSTSSTATPTFPCR
jgi:hypothetical protein